MKLLGLIGGVSPESTAIYYRLLNNHARTRLGGSHSARLILWSFDFHLIDAAYRAKDWALYKQLVVEAGMALKAAGVEVLMICSNTTHLGAEAVKKETGLPLIHVIDALAAELRRRNVVRPLLLGTPFVMEEGFYRNDLKSRFGVETLVPEAGDRAEVERIIFDELVWGNVSESSRARLLSMVDEARKFGADGVILGCTELSMILSQDGVDLPVFDTTEIHAAAASEFAFSAEAD
jgi:aspartate racemase